MLKDLTISKPRKSKSEKRFHSFETMKNLFVALNKSQRKNFSSHFNTCFRTAAQTGSNC